MEINEIKEVSILELHNLINNGEGQYEILTPNGFIKIGVFYVKKQKNCFRIKLENNFILEGSIDHLVETTNDLSNDKIELMDHSFWLRLGNIEIDDLVYTKDGNPYRVIEKECIGIHDTYDLEVLSCDHKYYSNDIVSHNSGKTTLLVDKMANIEKNNPGKKCLYISSEMNPIDNRELAEELPQLMELNTLYLADYENPKVAIEEVLGMGWDYVLMDSFMDVKDKIKDSQTKLTASAVETWLINTLVKHTKGENELKKYTAFDVIQHITKGGEYAGSTKLKHNTTAMMYVRIDEITNQRYVVYVKNRRGDIRKKLYMVLDKVNRELNYDVKKYNELEKAIEIQKQMDSFQTENDSRLLELLQSSDGNDDQSFVEAESILEEESEK